jgi:A/G-specific adenine glycosylase
MSFRASAATEESVHDRRRRQIPRCARNDRDADAVQGIRRALLRWYGRNARDLPWRRTRDPYRIWLAEVLLQQTRVETTLPYYQRFVERFPTVHALAGAKLDEVLRLWAGLGYYTRARNLHKAARIIAIECGGAFPQSAEALQRLPGVGRYTAAAIASIAFSERAAVLDGNVQRVLTRLFAIRASIAKASTQRRLWELAETLLAPRRPGEFNQAMMELGALICLPRNPACDTCPVRKWCAAAARGIEKQLPTRAPKRSVPTVEAVAAAVRRNGRYLIVQRPPTGLLGGLWQLPSAELRDGGSHTRALQAHLHKLLGVRTTIEQPLGTVTHVFSHRRLRLHVYRCRIRGKSEQHPGADGGHWVTPRRFNEYAFASVDRKVLGLL